MKKGVLKGRKFPMSRVLTAMLVFLLLASLYPFLQNEGKKECRSDADCVKVQKTCCPCSMGGNEVCAGKAQAENLTAKNCPSDLVCPALYGCKIKSCVCIRGKCGAVPISEQAK